MRQIHEYSVDRATMTARLGATNPVRKYIRGPVDECPPIQVQLSNGELHFYDQGGQPLTIDEVPEAILAHLKKNPLRRGNETVEQVLKFCEFCPRTAEGDLQPIASGEYEAHLKEHVKQAALSAQKVAADPEAYTASPTDVAQGKAKQRARKTKGANK